jgi:hypothetical protein
LKESLLTRGWERTLRASTTVVTTVPGISPTGDAGGLAATAGVGDVSTVVGDDEVIDVGSTGTWDRTALVGVEALQAATMTTSHR